MSVFNTCKASYIVATAMYVACFEWIFGDVEGDGACWLRCLYCSSKHGSGHESERARGRQCSRCAAAERSRFDVPGTGVRQGKAGATASLSAGW